MKIYSLTFLLLITVSSFSLFPGGQPVSKEERAGPGKLVFKSTDGGQTWQDISKGLPANLQEEGIMGNSVFANDNGLFLRAGDGLYRSNPNVTAPFWTKEIFPEQSSNAPGKSGISSNHYWGVNLKKANGTSVWSPVFDNYQTPGIRSTFETAGGTIFIGTDRGFFRSVNNGKNWKQVHAGDLVGHMAESNGVLVAISNRRIIRSTDNGENWVFVTSKDNVFVDVKKVKGGFAALIPLSVSKTRRVGTSYDGGKTWQTEDPGHKDKAVIDAIFRNWNDRPRMQSFMTGIIQVGENFLCTHPDGIFKSSDKGKTWKLLLPSEEDKGYYLFILDSVIYAMKPSKQGC